MNRRAFIRSATGALLIPAFPAIVRAITPQQRAAVLAARPRPQASGLFDPRTISNMFGWYRSSDNNGSNVSCYLDSGSTLCASDAAVYRWSDESGASNHLTGSAIEAYRPVYKTNRTGLLFNGTSSYLQSAVFGSEYSQPNNYCAVINIANTSAVRMVYDGREFGSRNACTATAVNNYISIYQGTADITFSNTTWPMGSYIYFIAGYNSTSSYFRLNGVDLGSPSGNPGTEGMGGLTVGARYALNNYWFSSYICELMCYNKTLTAGEIANLEGYCKAKYGL